MIYKTCRIERKERLTKEGMMVEKEEVEKKLSCV
jgi:hypothetical protein